MVETSTFQWILFNYIVGDQKKRNTAVWSSHCHTGSRASNSLSRYSQTKGFFNKMNCGVVQNFVFLMHLCECIPEKIEGWALKKKVNQLINNSFSLSASSSLVPTVYPGMLRAPRSSKYSCEAHRENPVPPLKVFPFQLERNESTNEWSEYRKVTKTRKKGKKQKKGRMVEVPPMSSGLLSTVLVLA